MAIAALIVAVENYPDASGLANQLPGTIDAATAFCDWLEKKKGVFRKGHAKFNPKTFFCCAEDKVQFRTHGTTRAEIVQAIVDLEKAAKDNTDELYCYFGGHGFCYPRDELVQEDIFVASDFKTLKLSGAACLKLGELMDLLTPALGPGDHYYFIDACRTEVKFGEVRPTDLGVTFDRSQLGFAGKAVLFSIEQGLAARVDSHFSDHLIDGLHGKGRAKGWQGQSMYVKFDSLCNYVKSKSKKGVSHLIGESDGLILKLDPTPSQKCTIRVVDADPADRFDYVVKLRRSIVKSDKFTGAEHAFEMEPDDYQIDVEQSGAGLQRIKPPATDLIDLYDPAEVEYQKPVARGFESVGSENMPSATPAVGTVNVYGAAKAAISIQNSAGDVSIFENREALTTTLDPGQYRVLLQEGGQVVGHSIVNVKAGESLDVDPLPELGPLHTALLAQIAPNQDRAIQFSETLGDPTADRDLGLWLAYLGASRIVGWAGEFSKLNRVKLSARFENIPPGKSALFVLSGIEGQSGPSAVGVGKNPRWIEMTRVHGVDGLFEFATESDQGSVLLNFQISGQPPITVSTCTLPNRATLITLATTNEPSPTRMYQFMLPIKELMPAMPQAVRSRIEQEPLKIVRFMTHVQRLFAQDHSLVKAFGRESRHTDSDSMKCYDELIKSKWLDPIGSIIAANDLLRRGVLNPKSPLAEFRGVLPVMVRNLREYFGRISDIEALAKAIGEPYDVPSDPPLLADSVTGFSLAEQRRFMQYPNNLRRRGTPWVVWTGAVEPHFA